MRVVPVIDLLGGVVVRGVAGRREQYRPIQSRLAADPQPATVARAFGQQFRCDTVYVADLDAIQSAGPEPSLATTCYEQIAACGLALWLDAGIGTALAAQRLLAAVAPLPVRVDFVVGLESLRSPAALDEIAAVLPQERTLFSLDLKGGVLNTGIGHWLRADPLEMAGRAVAGGISRLIVLDLADVGMSRGTRTLGLCHRLRQEFGSAVEITAGGGVRGVVDLLALQEAGCNAALVASALHDGLLTPGELNALRCRE